MKIVFYSTRCPQCRILENMMTRAKIEYEQCNDIDVMNSKGIMSVPCLEVDGNIMDFKSAFQWVKGIEA